jgi:adenylate cyclase
VRTSPSCAAWFKASSWAASAEKAIAARTFVIAWKYGLPTLNGVLRVDDAAVGDMEDALHIAEACGDDGVVGSVHYTLGTAPVFRGNQTDRQRRLELLAQVRDLCVEDRFPWSELPSINVYLAFETARDGDYDGALPQIRLSVEEMFIRRQFTYALGAAALLVETLIRRGKESDLAEAEGVVERLAAVPGAEWVARDIMVLRLRTLLAKARGEAGYRGLRDRYRALAASLSFEGHMHSAEAMP